MSSNVSLQTPSAAVVFAPFVPPAPSIPPAWAADVVSSNIVGYQKITLHAGYNMIGGQFTKVGGGDLNVAENDFLPDEDVEGMDPNTGDFTTYLMPWTGSDYAQNIYWAGNVGWGEDYDNKWLAGDWTPASRDFAESEGTWLWTPSAGSIKVCGEVVTTNVTVQLTAGYNMICNPFPCTTTLASIVPSASMSGMDGNTGDFSSYIMPWSGSDYAQNIYWAGNVGWGEDYDNKWLAGDWTQASRTFACGEGFWVYTPTACSVTFVYPAAE